ncbi:MAG TPA: indolepyruvate ferredoxin oxidoreductase subunit alpha [Chitinispirillaceae bacterium]|nr:indolepyruvate ferredoxin oxidoreductase subunit alpha [Chitinispirillaceae bacterium]
MKQLMLGNEAIARGAWEAGVTVSTAYPGTPSTEITEFISKYPEINAEWSVNEKVAFEIAMGASIAGARAIVSMKHVGLNNAMDPFMSISYPGVNGGLVVIVADDPGQHSSQNEQDTRWLAIAAKVPLLEPSDSAECLQFVKDAFDISEQFDTPVVVRLTTRVAHSQSIVIPGERANVALKSFDQPHGKYIVAPAYARKRRVVAEERMSRLAEFSETTKLNRCEHGSTGLGIISSGTGYQYAKEVFPDASFFKIGLANPLPKEAITAFVKTCQRVIVVEEVESIYEMVIKSWGLNVEGSAVLPRVGELSSRIIREKILGEAPDLIQTMPESQIPVRPPVMCAGCHHRGPFYVLKKLKLKVSGDIGCYTLAASPPLEAMHTSICMGASIGMAFGFEKARGKEYAAQSVAVIGDSTFWHSGLPGLVDIVYNKGYTTVIVLDNSITAMTGHQDNPSTGKTLDGSAAVALDPKKIAEAVGIKRIREVDAYDIVALEKVIKEEVAVQEPSLIITKRPCCLIKGQKVSEKKCFVNIDKCIGCRKCLSAGCPAISFLNGKAYIDALLCTGCGVCSSICSLNAISTSEGGAA